MIRYLILLANYNTWVNSQIFNLCGQLSELDYRKDRGVFFGSIHATLNHLLLVDILWLGRLKGEKNVSIRALDQILFEDFTGLKEVRQEYDGKLIRYVESLDETDLERIIPYTRMAGQRGEAQVHETLLTLFNHQTHHRGQVHAMLNQSGIEKRAMPDIAIIDYLASIRAAR